MPEIVKADLDLHGKLMVFLFQMLGRKKLNFTKHYTSAKYYVDSHLLICTLDELILNGHYCKLFLFPIIFVYQLALATF